MVEQYISIAPKERLQGIVFARACCAIGIIIYHYFCHSAGSFKFLFTTANSDFGFLYVTVFFAISGAVLYYNYPEVSSLKTFYFNRWKSIFPAFYLCFLFFFLKNVFHYHKVFYGPTWTKIFLSVFGIDGYFYYRSNNYYLIGEWFLGAIIMLYVLYPILATMRNKNRFVVPIILLLGYISMYYTNFFTIIRLWNLITCTASFYLGMVVVSYRDFFFKNRLCGFVSLGIFVFLSYVRLSDFVFVYQIQGLALLICLVQGGNYVMQTRVKDIVTKLSDLSFCIFLLQHKIIDGVLSVSNPAKWYKILVVLTITILLTIICAKFLSIAANYFTESKLFRKIEAKFVR